MRIKCAARSSPPARFDEARYETTSFGNSISFRLFFGARHCHISSFLFRSCLVPCSMFPRSPSMSSTPKFPPRWLTRAPFSTPSWHQIGPQKGPKSASNRPLGPRLPPRAVLDPGGPRWDHPERAQVGSKLAQVGPKSAPSRPQVGPKSSPRGDQEAPKGPLAAKLAREANLVAFGGSSWPPSGPENRAPV